jgi:hypothetical protein
MRGKVLEGQHKRRGLTLVELLIGSTIILMVILASLSLYMRSNRGSVDQLQFTDIQHDVRASMYFVARDIKSVGAGIGEEFCGYFLQGVNNDPNQSSASVQTDRLTILGNSDPLRLAIQSYTPGTGTITLEPDEFALYPYTAATYPDDIKGYLNRIILILPNPDKNPANGELGKITAVDLVTNTITFDQIAMSLPNGLTPGGAATDYEGGTVHFVEPKTYWLDVDGNYPGLTAGTAGYMGEPGVMYISIWNLPTSSMEHQPLAQNIEDLQFQFHGDMDGDTQLDDNNGDTVIDGNDYLNWDDDILTGPVVWSTDPSAVGGIRCVKVWILGRTENPYVSFSGAPPDEVRYIYGKPAIADSAGGASADKHRRFLLESTANMRNMSLSVYNIGT